MRTKRRNHFDKDEGFNKIPYEPKTKEAELVKVRMPAFNNQVRHEELELTDEELAQEYVLRNKVYRQD